ncbi:TRAP transporter small permease subunit [Oceanibacterium hippocampi]|uniref:TRAP transporter small permease protein n=1 Tax=Oceanibacterium hippocampi TaxID=745714 RepID=A0A1Y5R8T3_9PROT|nr:TRAP transporter small permease [Oceanibacterium hippocampi]SLN11421.1 Tripartite ATP-independent periplasmic transporters, DctQ component [Oceanibacterium hippocampi]
MTHSPSSSSHDGAQLLFFDALLFRVEKSFTFIAAFGIFFLMLLGVTQVVGRKLFDIPVYGYIDLVEQSTALFAFLGVAYCQRFGTHVRMELVVSHLSGRTLWVVEAIAIVFSIVIVSIFIPHSFDHFLRAWEYGDTTIDAEFPVWPSKLLVPIAFSVLWLRLVLQLAGFIRLSIRPDATPVAVTTVHDIETKARIEIEDAYVSDKNGASPSQRG